jgi:hypothetical protein
VYETVAECIQEDGKIKRPTLNNAIKENTVYNGFRWMFVDRDSDPNIIVNIQPTKHTKMQNLGYIAKLDETKTAILNVYLDRKTAAIQNGYASHSALDTPVKNETLTNGNYYMLYEKCGDALKTEFVKNNGEPILYKEGVGQYDGDGNLSQEFPSKYNVLQKLHMSDKTLAKVLDKNVAYHGLFYNSLGPKVSAI